MERKEIPTQPRAEYEFGVREFCQLLGIRDGEHPVMVHVGADKVTVSAWPDEAETGATCVLCDKPAVPGGVLCADHAREQVKRTLHGG
jgi:hypothetical protein